jgi:hypothetical protein
VWRGRDRFCDIFEARGLYKNTFRSSHDGKNIVSVCVGCSLVLLNTQKGTSISVHEKQQIFLTCWIMTECSRDNMILNVFTFYFIYFKSYYFFVFPGTC